MHTLLDLRLSLELPDALVGGTTQTPEQRAVVEEVGPDRLGEREDPLGVADILEYLLLQEGRQLGRALGGARQA